MKRRCYHETSKSWKQRKRIETAKRKQSAFWKLLTTPRGLRRLKKNLAVIAIRNPAEAGRAKTAMNQSKFETFEWQSSPIYPLSPMHGETIKGSN